MFPEALMLHYLDDLDSKMESMRAHFEREAGLESAWTGYNPSLGRPLLNTAKFLEKKPNPAPGDLGSNNPAAAETLTFPGMELETAPHPVPANGRVDKV